MQATRAPIDRFWTKVDRNGPTPEHRPDLGPCWLWTASRTRHGYGQFHVDGLNVTPHRWHWEHVHGPVPDGLHLDHLCRVRHCVRPDHMEPVTPRVNNERSTSPSAGKAEQTECANGHPWAEQNTYRWTDGARRCRVCVRAATRRYRARLATEGGQP